MNGPKGFVESLGDDSGPEQSESGSSGGMLEQHLQAFKRALDGGNWTQAASCFQAAIAEAGDNEGESEESGEEEY